MGELTLPQLAGVAGMIGAAAYAAGDVLMLAPRVGPRRRAENGFDFGSVPGFERRAELFETLARMPPSRLTAGALLGVFATPFVLAGVWLVYLALVPAGPEFAVPAGLLLAVASILGSFVHGTFLPLGEWLALLEVAAPETRPAVLDGLRRHLAVVKLSYGVVFLAAIIGAFWYSAGVALGGSSLPRWMAAVNPVTLTAAWLFGKRLLPDLVVRHTEGAGFNIAYFVFFAALTAFA